MASADVFTEHERARRQLLWQASILLLAFGGISSHYMIARQRYAAAQQCALVQLQTITSRARELLHEYLLRPDGSACFPFASEGIRDIFGLSPDEVAADAAPIQALIHPEDAPGVAASAEASAETLTPWVYEYRVHAADGTLRWLAGNAIPQKQADGSVLWHGFTFDITERKLADAQLRIAAAEFESEEGMFITDLSGHILRVNQAFSRITGFSASDAIGKKPSLLSSGCHDAAFYAAMRASIEQSGSWQGEIWNRRRNGEVFPEWLTITAVRDDQHTVTHYVSTLADITRRKAAEAEIQQMAFYDSLTGLPNRRLFTDRLQQALAKGMRRHRNGALFFIDLDNFKNLNDTYGHDQGDTLLRHVAERLNYCVRESDTVARFGGDEFVVMLQDLSDNPVEAAAQAETVGQKMLDALGPPYQFGHFTYHSSASVGGGPVQRKP